MLANFSQIIEFDGVCLVSDLLSFEQFSLIITVLHRVPTNQQAQSMDLQKDVHLVILTIHRLLLVCSLNSAFRIEIDRFFLPDVLGNRLSAKSLCASARQSISQHYNLHSMYGYFQAQATNK